MDRNWGTALQIILLGVNIFVPVFLCHTTEQRAAVTLFVSGTQAILGFQAYGKNPDGSSAEIAYRKDVK